jgi:tetratricopeptide (TPR) repeat protein
MALKIARSTPSRLPNLIPSSQTDEDVARLAFLDERWGDAHQAYLKALEQSPHRADLYQELGICLLKMGEHEKSLLALCRALRYDRKLLGAVNATGIVLFELGYPGLAGPFFKRVLELAPDHPLARQSLIACMRAPTLDENVPASLRDIVDLARPGDATISLCMIVKNEEQFLEGCLQSVQGAVDEIVIVDTGSSDRTVEIAERYGARILHHPWTGNFAEARNVGIDAATMDWILVLDADERLAPDQATELRKLVQNELSAGYSLTIDNFVGDESAKGRQVATIFRLFRNRPDIRFEGRIHEQVIMSAQRTGLKTYPSAVHIIHLGYTQTTMDERDKLNRNLDLLLKQLEEEPDNPYVHYNLGQTYKMMGQIEEAAGRFQLAMDQLRAEKADTGIPYFANLYFALPDVLRMLKRHDEARKWLEEGLRIYPDFPDLHFTLGSVHLEQERYLEACRAYENCVALGDRVHAGGTDPALTGHKGQNALGICKARLGRHVEAAEHFRRAVSLHPKPDAELLTNLGIVLSQGGQIAEAIDVFVQALERDPAEMRAWLNLATLSYRLERFQESVDAWERVLAIEPDIENGRILQAEALLRLGQLDRARVRLLEVFSECPDHATAWLNWGLLHLLEQDWNEAGEALARVGSPEARALASVVKVLAGHPVDELDSLEQLPYGKALGAALDLLLLTHREPVADRLLAWLDGLPRSRAPWEAAVAQVLLTRGYASRSLQHFLKARELAPDDAGIYVGLGEACLGMNLKEDALVMFEQAVNLAPAAPFPRRRLAELRR